MFMSKSPALGQYMLKPGFEYLNFSSAAFLVVTTYLFRYIKELARKFGQNYLG